MSYFTFVILLGIIAPCLFQFIKDQNIDSHIFPPMNYATSKGIPVGHLRPLGYQRPAEGRIKVMSKEAATPQLFYENAIAKKRPLVVRAGFEAPAINLWGDKNLSTSYPNASVYIVSKKGRNVTFDPTTLTSFLKKYHYDEIQLSGLLPEEMKEDLTIPKFIQCPPMVDNLQYAELFISSGPNSRPITFKAGERLICQVSGRTDVIVVPDKFHVHFVPYFQEEIRTADYGESELDHEVINGYIYESVARVPWYWATLKAGDCAYVPADHLHQERTFGRSIAVAMYFTAFPDAQTCKNDDTNDIKMSETEFIYSAEDSITKKVNIKKWTGDLVQKMLNVLIGGRSGLGFKEFKQFYETTINKTKLAPYEAKVIFGHFDQAGRDTIRRTRFNNILSAELEWLAQLLNGEDVPLTLRISEEL